jgi:lipopolysaccharide export system protein LptA
MSRHPNLLFIFLFFMFYQTAAALPNDGEKPMKIVADASLFNYKTGIDTYEGNVKVDQGTTHLIADKLVTEKNEHHKIISAIAYGTHHLAELTTLPSVDAKILHAKSNIIKFYPSTSILVLEDNVMVTQGENSFHGSLIIYNMKEQMVAAPASKNGRATIVIDAKTQKS